MILNCKERRGLREPSPLGFQIVPPFKGDLRRGKRSSPDLVNFQLWAVTPGDATSKGLQPLEKWVQGLVILNLSFGTSEGRAAAEPFPMCFPSIYWATKV